MHAFVPCISQLRSKSSLSSDNHHLHAFAMGDHRTRVLVSALLPVPNACMRLQLSDQDRCCLCHVRDVPAFF